MVEFASSGRLPSHLHPEDWQAVRTDCKRSSRRDTIDAVPRVSQDQLDARRHEILAAARSCFARFGYEGATVRRLEDATGLSRGAIFHHFRDKDSLFLAVAEDDAAEMAETVARNGLVQVMRDLLDRAGNGDTAGWLGSQLERYVN